MAYTPKTITIRAKTAGPASVKSHAGGFIEHGSDGPKAFLIGFATEDGNLVTVPRDAFEDAATWIAEQESSPEDKGA